MTPHGEHDETDAVCAALSHACARIWTAVERHADLEATPMCVTHDEVRRLQDARREEASTSLV